MGASELDSAGVRPDQLSRIALEISLLQNRHVMCNVPCDYVSQSPDRHRVSASYPAPPPRLVRHIPKQRHSRTPNIPKFRHLASPRILIRPRRVHTDVLIETWEGIMKIAPKPQSPKRKRALRIIQMAEHPPNAPLLRPIPV